VNLYQKRKAHLQKIDKTILFIKREINRKDGKLKLLPAFETWEYDESIRNHPLSIDLDLCNKQGLFPYLDTTVSSDAWKLFQDQLLQLSPLTAKGSQTKIQTILKSRSFTYQLLRKVEIYREPTNEKTNIHVAHLPIDFWKKRKLLKLTFPFLSIFTPFWLVVSSLFSLPFSSILLLINFILFVTYRKDSSRIWNQIKAYSNSILLFESAWKRMDPKNRKTTAKMVGQMMELSNSSEWIISPIPHIVLNVLFLWDLWKVKGYQTWFFNFNDCWEKLRISWISLEASLPIAHFSFLNPEYKFPSLISEKRLEAKSIMHPLIDKKARVSNPIPKRNNGSLMIITGSNMSGKTTYLRSIAINLLIAGIGGPISGNDMLFSDFKIYTLIRSQDSLENGISFFYSEVRRLAEIIHKSENSNETPVLFLDEILKGTNSRERQIATREILFALQQKGAIVFLTTHDLELAEMSGASLYHFTELEEKGEMIFDYKIREGISHTTNALRILKKEGIPIRDNLV